MSKRSSPGEASSSARRRHKLDPADAFLTVLAEADCTLMGSSDCPLLGSGDVRQLQMKLERRFASDDSSKSAFLVGLQAHITEDANLRRILKPIAHANAGAICTESLARAMLNVPSIQIQVGNLFLEKLPEYFDENDSGVPLKESVSRLILSQFRWLDYLADSSSVTRKLLEVLSICPLDLKKEIISFLPELVADADHEMVMNCLEKMLHEDLQIIVPVLDAFSNLNLDKLLYEQVVEIALSSLRSADAEDLPLVVRFLMQSTTSENARRIVQHLRDSLHFVTSTDVRAARPDRKLKGKSSAANCEALVLDALRSGARFQSTICDVFLKEIKSTEGERNHKVLDVWFLLILHSNGGLHRKAAEALFQRKVATRGLSLATLRLSVKGHGNALQEYFHTLTSVCEGLLRSKDAVCRHVGTQMYMLLFEEFSDMYHRQEVLGSLITHTGTGITAEVTAALDAMCLLAENHPYDMLPVASFINGILDYIESFPSDSLHQVYRIFSHMATACWSVGGSSANSSVANDLLIFITKQVMNPDLRYKHMGIIGVVTLISCLDKEASSEHINREETLAEAISLLRTTLDMCKTSCIARGFFHDELAAHIETRSVHSSVVEWCSKHASEFETFFLEDLENGHTSPVLPEGQLWMNLDDRRSPVFLNMLGMLQSNNRSISSSLQFLCSNFRLLAAVERLTNQELLGSIDALLGCPIYLPKAEVFVAGTWAKLSKAHKEHYCVCLFYAVNWIRELINAFSSQLGEGSESCLTQGALSETVRKLVDRLKNLFLLERVLSECLKDVPYLLLPQLHCFGDYLLLKGETGAEMDSKLPKLKRKNKDAKGGPASQASQGNSKLRQETITNAFRKADGSSQGQTQNVSSANQGVSKVDGGQTANANNCSDKEPEEEGNYKVLKENSLDDTMGSQKWKLRPLSLQSLNILRNIQDLECATQLPLCLYLLRELLYKLESLLPKPTGNFLKAPAPKLPSGLGNMGSADVLLKVKALFPSIRAHLDSAASILLEQRETENNYWTSACHAPSNPKELNFGLSKTEIAESVMYMGVCCVGKTIQCSQMSAQENLDTMKELLVSFAPNKHDGFPDLLVQPAEGSLGFMSCSAYQHFDSMLDAGLKASPQVATGFIVMLKELIDFLRELANQSTGEAIVSDETITYLCRRLSSSARRLIEHDWGADAWKGKYDVLQRLLKLYIERSESPIEVLRDLSNNVMTQVPAKGGKFTIPGYPALTTGTFVVWYRVQHEIVFQLFGAVVKQILACGRKTNANNDRARELLDSANQCVAVHVSLVGLSRSHEKTTVHAVALKYGGKFVDTFMKALEFMEATFELCKDVIMTMVKELQKGTRTIQAICGEAKGQKKLPVTCKVPAVKRSMERYVFSIKGLLHRASSGDAFWMGNLKHKNLQGREIGSQLPLSDEEAADAQADESDDNGNVQDAPSEADGDQGEGLEEEDYS